MGRFISRFISSNSTLFIASLSTLAYFFYLSMVGILVVLIRLMRTYGSPCLDGLTKACAGAIALLLVFSAADAYNPGEATLQLANFLPYLVMFAYLPGLFTRLEILENLAIALVLTSIPLSIIAIGEFIIKSPFLPEPWQAIAWIDAIRKAPHRGRAMAMFDHPNVMASYLVVVLGLALGLWMVQLSYGVLHRRDLTTQHAVEGASDATPPPIDVPPGEDGEEKYAGKEPDTFTAEFSPSTLLIWATGLILAGIYCTGSRNGLAIALSQLAVFVVLGRLNRRILVTVAFLVGISATAVLGIGLGERQIGILNLADDPRVGVWAIAADLMRERPWLGWGLGNFKFLYPPRLIDPEYQDVFHPHNIWLLLGTEAGIPVMILMSLLVGFICYRAVRYCLTPAQKTDNPSLQVSGRAIALGYLLAFWGCLGFALFDVTFYDVRVNALNWTMLAALYAIPFGLYPCESDAVNTALAVQSLPPEAETSARDATS